MYVWIFVVFSYPREQKFYKPEAGELLFKVGNMCWFKIWVERVCKDIGKAFPKDCKGVKQLKNNIIGLLGYQYNEFVGACPIYTLTKIKTSINALPLHKKML